MAMQATQRLFLRRAAPGGAGQNALRLQTARQLTQQPLVRCYVATSAQHLRTQGRSYRRSRKLKDTQLQFIHNPRAYSQGVAAEGQISKIWDFDQVRILHSSGRLWNCIGV
jgi:hypothetical protein